MTRASQVTEDLEENKKAIADATGVRTKEKAEFSKESSAFFGSPQDLNVTICVDGPAKGAMCNSVRVVHRLTGQQAVKRGFRYSFVGFFVRPCG